MADGMIERDDRPEIEPDMFSYRPLPDDPEAILDLWREMGDGMRKDGATWLRMTIVNEDYQRPPYPDGLYMEGWRVDPARLDPPGKSAPFNYPLVAVA